MYGIFRHRPRIVPNRRRWVYLFTPTVQPIALPNKMMASISHYMALNIGDKIKAVAKTTNGNVVRITANALRFRIRKKL